MSLLRAVGFIINGGGLKEAFCVGYAENFAEKALLGYASSRAIRGHFFIQLTALTCIIFQSLKFTDEEANKVDTLLRNLGSLAFGNDMNKDEFIAIRDKFMKQIEKIQKRRPTA